MSKLYNESAGKDTLNSTIPAPLFGLFSPAFTPLFRPFVEKMFTKEAREVNFGRNSSSMETLSHILASFDIFQVILNAFPQIFMPVIHAFGNMFRMFSEIAMNQFSTHPGLISGTIMFFLVYVTYSGLSKLRHSAVPARQVSAKQTH